jgi:hypothetical protein
MNPAKPSEKLTRSRKPPTGFTDTTSMSWSSVFGLAMAPVLHQLDRDFSKSG